MPWLPALLTIHCRNRSENYAYPKPDFLKGMHALATLFSFWMVRIQNHTDIRLSGCSRLTLTWTGRDLKPMHVEPWIRGIIRSQGAVMVEPIYEKILDCATEWIMSGGKATFLGVSVFEASGRGKYHRNIKANQLSLWNMIGVLTQQVIDKQRYALQSVIGTDYDGPVGIDMLLTSTGTLHPCVELNLRRTMGSILIHPDDKSLVAKYPAMF